LPLAVVVQSYEVCGRIAVRYVQHVAKHAGAEHAVGVADTACNDLDEVSGVVKDEDVMSSQP